MLPLEAEPISQGFGQIGFEALQLGVGHRAVGIGEEASLVLDVDPAVFPEDDIERGVRYRQPSRLVDLQRDAILEP